MEKTFWELVQGLEGRTVSRVRNVGVPGTGEDEGNEVLVVQVECTDGYAVQLFVDYEDVDLGAREGNPLLGLVEEVE